MKKKTNLTQDKKILWIQSTNLYSPRFMELIKRMYLGSYSNTSASLFPFLSFHCTFRRVLSQFLDMPPLRGGNKELESLSSSPLTWSSTFSLPKEEATTGLCLSMMQPLPSLESISTNNHTHNTKKIKISTQKKFRTMWRVGRDPFD